MVPSGVRLWKLSSNRDDGLGLSCSEAGLFLAGAGLVERRENGYAERPAAEFERLIRQACGGGVRIDWVMAGARMVAAALNERNLCLAQIAAVQMRLPDLPDKTARARLEAEDCRIKTARSEDAPFRGGTAPQRVAQSDEDERAPQEMLDPEAPVRQAQWEAAIAILREIDPANPQLASLTAPG